MLPNKNSDNTTPKTLYQKVFDSHTVRDLGDNQYQLFIGLHLIHEATSPQAFDMLREAKMICRYPQLNFATADHVTPTENEPRPLNDALGEGMLSRLEENVREFGIHYFAPEENASGIVHVIGPEYGLTQPGMTIACGDSHTSTHGAFGAVALGIGTSQIRDILGSQTIVVNKLKVRRVEINGELSQWVSSKDVILHVIKEMGPKAGVGYVYEFAGSCVDAMSMDERMTLCNMAVEAGARCGYVNPDETTFAYLEGREFAPQGDAWHKAVSWWRSLRSDSGAEYDSEITINASDIRCLTTWGVNLGQTIPISNQIPVWEPADADIESYKDALNFMNVKAGQKLDEIKIDVAFIGSCTNGRYSDFKLVADHLQRSGKKVHAGVRALAVPGSYSVYEQMNREGVTSALVDAGFEVRLPGCSMCLAMNPDKLVGTEVCASSSNRNFKGRQGSPNGRTLIMSPLSVAASAIQGHVANPEHVFSF
jgi:3-isopropylmalate/(R)-2-methylmalate dehydratase large subunit